MSWSILRIAFPLAHSRSVSVRLGGWLKCLINTIYLQSENWAKPHLRLCDLSGLAIFLPLREEVQSDTSPPNVLCSFGFQECNYEQSFAYSLDRACYRRITVTILD